ncbi:MAG TPA: RdgB/HAM1 family non-canonical purine NTP pyrophosphatase [Verrucomicrobiae bacterium]|jgi:XTP/dITP diphosphohydrolase|nr:RdgB/HAM1 family non-canonical purine NTP pyrophosphatase [Verrucomicrobiae bacterium]
MNSSQKLLVASTNKKKLEELRELLKDMPFQLLGLKDLPSYQEVPETGRTFEENAALKALGYAAQSGLMTLAEDSGLCCDALEGAPGVYSARFAGEGKSDEDNNDKLLRLLHNLPDNCRSAYYVSAVVIVENGKVLNTVRGEVHGVIARERAGTGGFGYDPIFYFPPYQKTFGQVSPEMKHRVSHRAKALEGVRQFFAEWQKSR